MYISFWGSFWKLVYFLKIYDIYDKEWWYKYIFYHYCGSLFIIFSLERDSRLTGTDELKKKKKKNGKLHGDIQFKIRSMFRYCLFLWQCPYWIWFFFVRGGQKIKKRILLFLFPSCLTVKDAKKASEKAFLLALIDRVYTGARWIIYRRRGVGMPCFMVAGYTRKSPLTRSIRCVLVRVYILDTSRLYLASCAL